MQALSFEMVFLGYLTEAGVPIEFVLMSRGISMASRCACCVMPQQETIKHVFFQSQVVAAGLSNNNWQSSMRKCAAVFIVNCIIWQLWLLRNDCKFNNSPASSGKVIKNVEVFIHAAFDGVKLAGSEVNFMVYRLVFMLSVVPSSMGFRSVLSCSFFRLI